MKDLGSADCLVLAQYYFPEKIGSAPYCTDLAEWLARGKDKVRVLTCRPHYPTPDDFPAYRDGSRDREIVNRVEIERVAAPGRNGAGAMARLRSDLGFVGRALGLVLRGRLRRADSVVAFVPSIFALLLGRLLRRRGGRLVAVVHDIESGLARGLGLINRPRLVAALEALERVLLNCADEIVVLTPQMAGALHRLGVTRPVTVLPIWAEDAAVPAAAAVPVGAPLTIMYSGNFGRKQGLDQLIELGTRLQAGGHDLRIVLQGDGSERPRLEAEAGRRGLANIEFRPLVPKAELAACLQRADIHLVPQDSRAADYALPSKITSIMAVGRPFVCTAEPGSALADIVAEAGAGLCVPPGDPEGFLAAVLRLIDSSELRAQLGGNGERYVREQLGATKILQQYERLIRRDPAAHRPAHWTQATAR